MRLATRLLAAVVLLAPVRAGASDLSDQKSCAKRVGEAAMNYALGVLGTRLSCERDNLARADGTPCAESSEIANALDEASDKLATALRKCAPVGFGLLCPAGTSEPGVAWSELVAGEYGTDIDTLVRRLYLAPTCGAPAAPVSKAALDCSRTLSNEVPKAAAKIQQCISKCEVSWTASGGEVCVDTVTGEPLREKVVECVDRVRDRFRSSVGNRCAASGAGGRPVLEELGCPLGASSPDELLLALRDPLDEVAIGVGPSLFHSSCRTVIPVNPVSPTTEARLDPSERTVTVSCGQVLDEDFFDGDDSVTLLADLNCQNASGSDGLVLDAPGVDLRFDKNVRLIGRGRAGSPGGVGVRLTDRADGVLIRRGVVKTFGTGILDSAGTSGLRIEQTTVRTNLRTGILLRGTGAYVSASSLQRNGLAGMSVEGSGNRIDSNTLEENGTSGIVVSGTDNGIENNQIGSLTDRGNGDFGLLVLGESNRVSSNRADANGAGGYEIRAAAAVYENNRATRNIGFGHRLTAQGTLLESNRADGNGGWEFVLAPFNLDAGGNRANGTTITFDAAGGNFE